jgi:two-component system LytT family response regulator
VIRTLIADDEPLARERVRDLLKAHNDITIVGEAVDGESALETLLRSEVDLLFLDVQMPVLDGLGLVELVPADRLPVIIFATAYDEYALRAFEAHALDFLLKPVQRDRFDQALAKARTYLRGRADYGHLLSLRRELEGGPYRRRFAVRRRNRIVIVKAAEIDWIEAQGNYVRIHAADSAHLAREPLHAMLAVLDPAQFLQVHRSAIVNMEAVVELRLTDGRLRLVLKHGAVIPVGAAFRERVENAFGKLQ